LLELCRMLRREFEPGEEIKGLAEIAAGIKLPRDRRQIFQAVGDMARLAFKNPAPLFLSELPPRGRFADRDQRRAGRLLAPERRLHRRKLLLLAALDIADMAHDAGEPPRGCRRQYRQRDRGAV